MKHSIITILLTLVAMTGWAQNQIIIERTEGSVTFVVDENLPPCADKDNHLLDGETIAHYLLREECFGKDRLVACSFADATAMRDYRKDAFFQSIVDAYAKHRPITLSPDMVWLIIGQGFARYVNGHAEQMRDVLVSHSDTMELVVETPRESQTGSIDWPMLIDRFASQIDQHTKGDIAQFFTADFTTTGAVERTASQITLMESMKKYFEYVTSECVCGIPYIKLEGTADDWRHVLAKTRRLEAYSFDFGRWTTSIEPILEEFILAAEGKPNQPFWQNIVRRQPLDKVVGRGCGGTSPTTFDGWLLTFFPDKNGVTPDSVWNGDEMPEEYVRVGFKHRLTGLDGETISETPMEVWSGFVGADVDAETHMVRPKIGWLVMRAETEEEVVARFREMSDRKHFLCLTVHDVPEALAKLDSICNLDLDFLDDVVIPDWFYDLKIRSLTIFGDITDELRDKIWKRFPQARINREYSETYMEWQRLKFIEQEESRKKK
ncbi:MAG: DUF4419 domain-containing protein [Bacteroidales bacterium]|nr:DUF4419 domain-containing protein [Bacteroidales bacterium]